MYTIIVAIRKGAPRPDAAIPGHEFLMVRNRRRGGRWELPGGRAQPGESPETCAQREFLEETACRMIGPMLVQRRNSPLGEGFVYLCRASKRMGSPRPDEIEDVRYFSRLPAPPALSFPDDPYDQIFSSAQKALNPKRT